MDKVYIETTIPSYVAAKLSGDIIIAARQQTTRKWWDTVRLKYDLYISEVVLAECRMGDPEAAMRRLELISDIRILKLTDDINKLATEYIKLLAIPEKARLDAYHLAFAVVGEMDYLLTWNCTHMAQGEIMAKLRSYNRKNGLFEPIILTPDELMEG
jgi:predicted nucleic acid-binding protein